MSSACRVADHLAQRLRRVLVDEPADGAVERLVEAAVQPWTCRSSSSPSPSPRFFPAIWATMRAMRQPAPLRPGRRRGRAPPGPRAARHGAACARSPGEPRQPRPGDLPRRGSEWIASGTVSSASPWTSSTGVRMRRVARNHRPHVVLERGELQRVGAQRDRGEQEVEANMGEIARRRRLRREHARDRALDDRSRQHARQRLGEQRAGQRIGQQVGRQRRARRARPGSAPRSAARPSTLSGASSAQASATEPP